jgi:hypothetical protein
MARTARSRSLNRAADRYVAMTMHEGFAPPAPAFADTANATGIDDERLIVATLTERYAQRTAARRDHYEALHRPWNADWRRDADDALAAELHLGADEAVLEPWASVPF